MESPTGGANELERFSIIEPTMRLCKPAANMALNEKVKTMVKEGKEISHFAFGQSPFPVPDCLEKALKSFAHVHAYLPIEGIPELREALTELHRRYDDINLDPEGFIVAPGSKTLLYLVLNAFNGPICLPSPCWITYLHQAELARKQTLILDTDRNSGWKVTPEILERGLEHLTKRNREGYKLFVLNNPGNPSGACYTETEIQNLSLCCRKHKVLVLADEIYSRLCFSGFHYSMAKFYPEGTLLVNGFSKWASIGGWRLGYIHIPSTLKPLYNAVLCGASYTYSCAPAPMQYAVAKVLKCNSEELDEYVKVCGAILKLISDFCYEQLSSVGITGHRSEAGYYFMPDFEVIKRGLAKKGVTTAKQMVDAMLQEADVALMECEEFLRPASELTTRFCFVCFDGRKALEEFPLLREDDPEQKEAFLRSHCGSVFQGIQRLKKFIEKYKN